MKFRNCLWFDFGEARRAVDFYVALFPDSRIERTQASTTTVPTGRIGDELVIDFVLLGIPFQAMNGGPGYRPNEAVSFQVLTEDQAETDRYWDALVADGGAEVDCGWCRDRWGFSWQISPRALDEGLADPDPAAARRVTEAMLAMRRIDVATIEAARRG